MADKDKKPEPQKVKDDKKSGWFPYGGAGDRARKQQIEEQTEDIPNQVGKDIPNQVGVKIRNRSYG